jgi:hypothetical protein
MNLKKLGLVALAGALTVAAAHAATSKAKAKQPAASAPARATVGEPLKPAPAPAAPAAMPMPPAAAGATAAAPAGPPGKAEIKELVFDAGNIERGPDLKHDFVIKNVGQYDLTVDAKPG